MKDPFLISERLYLRAIVPDDFWWSLAWLNNQSTTKYMQNGRYPKTDDDMMAYWKSMQKPNLYLAICTHEGEHIGNISLKNGTNDGIYSEIAIIIGDRDYWGEGYATEAIKILVDHCFTRLDIHKLRAGAVEENIGSIKAFVKAGFTTEGKEAEAVFCDGKWRDIRIMGLLKREWEVGK